MTRIKKLLNKQSDSTDREAQEASYYFQVILLVAAIVVTVLLAMYMPEPKPPVQPTMTTGAGDSGSASESGGL